MSIKADMPQEFVNDVKQVLEHLYDFPYLQKHHLASVVLRLSGKTSDPAQRLRRELMDAIEALNPGEDVFFRSPHARLYNLLHLHYVEGMTIQETAHELGISARQAYRDLRKGQESVAITLWNLLNSEEITPQHPNYEVDISSIQSEVGRIPSDVRQVDVVERLQVAQRAVNRLAEQQNCHLEFDFGEGEFTLWTNPVIAQQVFVKLLSYSIQHSDGDKVQANLYLQKGIPCLGISYLGDAVKAKADLNSPIITELAKRLGWHISVEGKSDGCELNLLLSGSEINILIVDDNTALVELLERFLSDYNCKLLAAFSGKEGLQLAETVHIDAIILDVMMPEMDGWEFLQRLRTDPTTENIPVIVCSVFNDPELAQSLGASGFVAKPIDRETIVQSLSDLAII